ncbi:fibronectin type III domain-containing protein [Halarcobacter sp.]|uniref:fibronectin type III domain-containing protein n=1 Tax=Halarcobacter TaxID=2321115 RepID=UPI003A8E5AE5
MKKLLLTLAFCVAAFANENNFVNMKNCESIKLSKLTSIVSCHQVDYLVEYRVVDDEEKDPVKKVTVVTKENQVVIKNLGR